MMYTTHTTHMMHVTGILRTWKGIGDTLRRGERYGRIRLGSRVDVRVPAAYYEPQVVSAEEQNSQYPKGQFIKAGADIIFKRVLEEE